MKCNSIFVSVEMNDTIRTAISLIIFRPGKQLRHHGRMMISVDNVFVFLRLLVFALLLLYVT